MIEFLVNIIMFLGFFLSFAFVGFVMEGRSGVGTNIPVKGAGYPRGKLPDYIGGWRAWYEKEMANPPNWEDYGLQIKEDGVIKNKCKSCGGEINEN